MPPETIAIIRRMLATSPEFRAVLADLLVESGFCRPPRGKAKHLRIKVASGMVASGNCRADVQRMLRERFRISRATAYRDLENVINLRQRSLFD